MLVPLWMLIAIKIGGSAIPPLVVSSSDGDLALAKPATCGFVSIDPRVDSRNAFSSRQELYETSDARKYASERYSKEPARFDTQSSFVTDALPFKVIQNTTCPFEESMCLLGPNSAITFDTELLNSHTHFGINAPAKDRVEYRWRSSCAVLNVTSKSRVFRDTAYNDVPISAEEPLVEVDLGPINSGPSSALRPNHTFLYRVRSLEPSNYEVKSLMSSDVVPPLLNIWNPIEALRAPNASVTVVFIAPHSVAYEKRVVDPVFQARNSSRNSFSKLWMPDYVFRIVGCVDQRQYCNPMNGSCTSLNSPGGDWSGPFVNNGISKQFATTTRLEEHARDLTIWSNIRSLGPGALIAHSLVPEHTYKSPGLPLNQWQLEARRWFETGLAKLQYKVVQYTNMDFVKPFADVPLQQPEIVDSNFGNITKLNEILQSQCESQLVKLNGRGQNVSVVGLVIILVLATVLMILSLALQWWVGRDPPRGEKRKQWQQEQLLALWQAAQGVNKK